MFDSVLEQNIPRRRLGRGAAMSFAVHAVISGAGRLCLVAARRSTTARRCARGHVLQSACVRRRRPLLLRLPGADRSETEAEDGAEDGSRRSLDTVVGYKPG